MKHITKQPARSRNKALAQRAAQLGCGISLIAVSAMLAARPAHAGPAPTPDPASVSLTGVPADSGSAGFVTAGSQQLNNPATVNASLNDAFGTSTVDNTATGSLPNTESVTGNELAAFATGSGQTNTVDFANIGTNDTITGIAVLAEQQNTFSSVLGGYLGAGDTDPYYDYAPTTIESAVTNSSLVDQSTNPADGDTLNNSSNLIESEVNGNVADSSVIGVVPLNYSFAEPGTLSLAGGDPGSGASGNVVVGSSQTNAAIDGGDGSTAGEFQDTISLNAVSTGDFPLTDTLSTEENDNAISSVFVGNSANNDIGVDLTSGANSGGPSFAGALVVANQQAGYQGAYGDASLDGPGFGGNGAYSNFSVIATNIGGAPVPSITLLDGAVTEDGNVISSSATGNSAVGAAGGPGNEISLGVSLAGATPADDAGNTINVGGTILSGGDLVLGNQQYQGGSIINAYTRGEIGANVENLVGSSINLSNNALTSSAAANNASNAIETPDGVGINLISGLAALTSEQIETSGAEAETAYGGIGAYAGYGGGTLSLTNSTVNLANDKIATTADGNEVANSVALTASTIDAGAAGAATGPASISGVTDVEPGADVADAGVSLNNLQQGFGPTTATQYSETVGAYIQGETLSNDSAIVTNPVFTSEAAGNSATNSITADGAQGVSGSVGLLSSQLQFGGTAAYLEDGDNPFGNFANIVLQSLGGDGGISGSTALLSGSESYAEATDNSATNTLDATGGTLSNAAGAAGTLGLGAQPFFPDVTAQAVSDLALVNEQSDFGEPAYADNYNSQDNIYADSTDAPISGSSFTVSGPAGNAPAAQALAIGNEALNALSALASTVLTDTAGLVNAQSNNIGAQALLEDNDVDVALNSAFSPVGSDAYDDGGDISDTSITVGTGAVGGSNPNILRALAYGNQASNVLSVSAGTVNPDATAGSFDVDGSVVLNGLPPENAVGAAYDLLNDQASDGIISAEDEYTELGIYMGNTVTSPSLTDVTASTAGNAVVASAFGNEASNSATVAANNLTAGEYLPLADVTNQQSNDAALSATLSEADDVDYPLLTTQLAGDGAVEYSSLGVTDNTVLTQAEGNDATNSLDTTTGGNNITDASLTPLGDVTGSTFDDTNSTDPLAFSEQNDQYQDGPITVDQSGANALVSTGGDVAFSTLIADTNAFEATGYGNNATNSLSFGGTNSLLDLLDTSAGLQNTQYTGSDLNVTLGSAGVAATPGDPAVDVPAVQYYVAPNTGENAAKLTGDELDVIGKALTFDVSGLLDTQQTAFEDAIPGGTVVDGNYVLAPGDYTVANLDVLTGVLFADTGTALYDDGGSPIVDQSVAAFDIPATGGTPAVPPSPSVLITVAGDIADSTLDVTGNTFNATAISNNAVNTQNIAATSVGGGADITGRPGAGVDDGASNANADYALVNNQSSGGDVTATAYGEAGINPTNTSAVTDSTLNVSDNSTLAEAESEVASNTLSLSATNSTVTPPTFALINNQSDDAGVAATAGTIGEGISFGLVVTAPGAIDASTLTMDDNTSEALAVENNATNLLSADVTNLADESGYEDAVAYFDPGTGEDVFADPVGDYTLTNVQTVYADTVSASDVTQVENSDATSITTAGLVDSTAELNGNTTSAFAEANAASNTLDMTSANSGANGALTNGQSSAATVEAEGGGFVGFALNGGVDDGPAAAAGSSISVSNNSTTVQGIGNQATNALNADTAATYGPQDEAMAGDGGSAASATYAVLNYQQNTGNVSAAGVAYYGSQLNGGGTDAPVVATTVTVSYNTVDAKAFGNSATNSATVSALNSGNATVALQNTQTNTGAITASVDDSEIGSEIGAPGASGATVAVGDNSIIASAIGNVATNAIASH